jgi:hypothetical protein
MEFSAQMKELLDYKSANHTSREVGPFAYLESQLEDLSITEDSLENRSHLLATEEKRINDLRLREFRSLGFA